MNQLFLFWLKGWRWGGPADPPDRKDGSDLLLAFDLEPLLKGRRMLHRRQTQRLHLLKGKLLLSEQRNRPALRTSSACIPPCWSQSGILRHLDGKLLACLHFSLNNVPAVERSLLDWESGINNCGADSLKRNPVSSILPKGALQGNGEPVGSFNWTALPGKCRFWMWFLGMFSHL